MTGKRIVVGAALALAWAGGSCGAAWGADGTGTVRLSFEENRHLRPERYVTEHGRRVSGERTQVLSAATVAPGATVQLTSTVVLKLPVVEYTARGLRCRPRSETGAHNRYSFETEGPEAEPALHVFPADSPAARPPFADTSGAVASTAVGEPTLNSRRTRCRLTIKQTEVRSFAAPAAPGRYAVTWGLPTVTRLYWTRLATMKRHRVPLKAVRYRIAGQLPTLTVQG